MRTKLEHVELVSSSGIRHPYYSVSPADAASENMFLRVTAHPPLDHVTTVSYEHDSVDFHVLVEAEAPNAQWEVDLWHNASSSSQWEALRLEITQNLKFCSATLEDRPLTRKWYYGRLSGRYSRPVSFTFRFRNRGDEGWRWIHDQSGAADGQLIYQASMKLLQQRRDLSYFVEGLDSSLTIEKVSSETPNTMLWSVTAPAAAANGDLSGYSCHSFGLPLHFLRWFSLVRLWSPWLGPRQGRTLPLAEKKSILYSFLRTDGLHVVALAVSGIDDILTVFKFEHDKIMIDSRNDREEIGVGRVVVAVGNSFEEANAAVMYHARKMISQYNPPSTEIQRIFEVHESQKKEETRPTWVQDWCDGFSFCTWNSLGQNLTEEKILGALQSLDEKGIRITNLIIDDNWQSLDNEGQNQMNRGWTDFEANPKAFPNGLKAAVSNIRKTYPDIKHVCVWHAILGYWGAISPTGKIAQTYKTIEVLKDDGVIGGKFTVVDAPDIRRMYDDFYSFLLSAGVDSVKTDAQFFLDEIHTAPARRSLISTYLSTWTAAQLRHFSSTAISCMSQTPQILFSCQLPNQSPAIPVRNSDDFFPDVEDSHPWHIFCNAHNALLAQHLNVLPDWDMFQSQHKWSGFHAAARCVSGGPIYVTDEPGKHDTSLIASMTAMTSRGQTVILRPSVIGRSTEAYIGYEDDRFCKVAAYDGASSTGSSFLGVFNCRRNAITEIISLSSFIGIEKDRKYAIKHHHPLGSAQETLSSGGAGAAVLGLNLPGYGWDVMSATPIYGPYDLSDELKGVEVSNLGLLGKMTGAAAIIKTEVSIRPSHIGMKSSPGRTTGSVAQLSPPVTEQIRKPYSRLLIRTILKALGTLGILIPKIEEIEWKERVLVLVEGKPMPLEFAHKSDMNKGLLELDVAGAWKFLELEGGWSNEIVVQVFVG